MQNVREHKGNVKAPTDERQTDRQTDFASLSAANNKYRSTSVVLSGQLFSMFGLGSPDLIPFGFKIRFYDRNSSPGTPIEVWNLQFLKENKQQLLMENREKLAEERETDRQTDRQTDPSKPITGCQSFLETTRCH